MAKRKTTIEELFDVFYELSEIFWMVGAVVSGLLAFGSLMVFRWVVKATTGNSLGWLSGAINDSWLGYAIYLLPLILLLLAILFAWRSINTYVTHHN